MSIRAETLKRLIEAEDRVACVWNEMLALYTPTDPPGDLVAFYDERECELCDFERVIYECYFEIYDDILERASQARNSLSASLFFNEADLLIVADSLSLREAALFPTLLPQQGPFKVESVDFFVVPLPTETKSLCRVLLGVDAPSEGRDGASFVYRYVPGPGATPHLPPSGNLLVWVRLPDATLEQVTAAKTRTVEHALKDTLKTVSKVLARSGRREAIIISDHGYLYASRPNHYWPLPSGEQRGIQRLFGRGTRLQEEMEKVEQVRAYEQREPYRKRFVFGDGFVAIRGRYWWATGAANEPLTAHGGCSLAEMLVPKMKVRVQR